MSKNDVVEIVALHVSRHGRPNHDEPEGSTVKDVYQCPCGKSTSTVIIYDWPGDFEVDKTMDCESCVDHWGFGGAAYGITYVLKNLKGYKK